MHYALVFYPEVDRALVDGSRRRHDPTVDLIQPHVTVMFPVQGRIGESKLVEHIQNVLENHSPFEVCLGGFHRSPDHWLFLTIQEGNRKVKELYDAVYTGILAKFRRDDIGFVPHLGLGLFMKGGSTYDWNHLHEFDFDSEACETVQRELQAHGTNWTSAVDTLHLVTIPDEVLEWASGARPNFPKSSRTEEVRHFRLREGSSPV